MLTLLITKTGIVAISLGTYCIMQFCAEVVLVRLCGYHLYGESGKNAQCNSIRMYISFRICIGIVFLSLCMMPSALDNLFAISMV